MMWSNGLANALTGIVMSSDCLSNDSSKFIYMAMAVLGPMALAINLHLL